MFMDEKSRENSFGNCEDLITELDFKLSDILSHIKLLANSTSENTDFEMSPFDINSIAMTLHDKVIAAIFVEKKLQLELDNASV